MQETKDHRIADAPAGIEQKPYPRFMRAHRVNQKRKPTPPNKIKRDIDLPAERQTALLLERELGAAYLDAIYGVKGWDIPFPSFADSLLQDNAKWRSTLAQYGFGLLVFTPQIFENNVLNTPRKVLGNFPACAMPGAICSNQQAYFGERASFISTSLVFLTYDLSRFGIPDGQIVLTGVKSASTDQAFVPIALQFNGLAWYQTFFNRALEVKFGYVANNTEFVGTFVGSNFASTFGPSASIPAELGQSVTPATAPSFRATWHLTDRLYDEAAVQRSLPVTGPTLNPIYDDVRSNPTGLDFSSSIRGTRVLYVNEFGFKNEAALGEPQTWARMGAMYNSSSFTNFTRIGSAPGSTDTGNFAGYLLVDRQLWQQTPEAAYRGIYLGFSAMYASPRETLITDYYEGRLYSIGLFNQRPTDMISLIYNHQGISSFLSDGTNLSTPATGFAAYHATNTVTISYLARLAPGVYGSVGVGYTDHPSVTYFKAEGSALNLLLSLTTIY
jgi:porin